MLKCYNIIVYARWLLVISKRILSSVFALIVISVCVLSILLSLHCSFLVHIKTVPFWNNIIWLMSLQYYLTNNYVPRFAFQLSIAKTVLCQIFNFDNWKELRWFVYLSLNHRKSFQSLILQTWHRTILYFLSSYFSYVADVVTW